jgi:hypothetical protein
MKTKLTVAAGVILLLAAVSAFAHHPFSAEYDWKKPVTLSGTVTKFEWSNPHSFLYMDAKDASGKMTHWTLEMGNPKALAGAGWSQNMLKAGDQVTVDAWLSKSRNDHANMKSVTLSDGRELAGGSSVLDMKKPKAKATATQ